MDSLTNKFVVSKVNLNISMSVILEIDDVGIIESKDEQKVLVFFIRIWDRVKLSKNDTEEFSVLEIGDAFPKKICNVCHKLLDTAMFARNQNGVNNRPIRRPSCKYTL